jgi:hypothetical protein
VHQFKKTPAKVEVPMPDAEEELDCSTDDANQNEHQQLKNGPDLVNLESFKQQLVELEEQKLLQKKIV